MCLTEDHKLIASSEKKMIKVFNAETLDTELSIKTNFFFIKVIFLHKDTIALTDCYSIYIWNKVNDTYEQNRLTQSNLLIRLFKPLSKNRFCAVFENKISIFSSFSPYEHITTISIELYPISISQLEDREMLAMLIGEKNDLIFVSLETYQVEKRTMLALGSTVNVGETLIQKGNNCIIGGNNIIGIVDINEGIVKRITKDKKLKTIKAMVNMNDNIIIISNSQRDLIAYDISIEVVCLLIQNEYNIYSFLRTDSDSVVTCSDDTAIRKWKYSYKSIAK